ncbi:MAG: hypothetical protein ACE3JK_10775 [Sporolactobacillus sp.]
MTQSIKVYKIEKYPNEFPVESENVNPGFSKMIFKTVVKTLGESEYSKTKLEKVQIIHPVADEFEGQGILEDGSIQDIVALSTTEAFPCFIKEKKFIYTAETKRIISEQALKRLRRYPKEDNKLVATPVEIDLAAFKKELEENEGGSIKGGWFKNMKIENVKVAYLGGGTVTESKDWERYETGGGIISALRMDIPTLNEEDEPIKILLTKDGNCVVYKNYGELDLLRVTMPVFEEAEKYIKEE